MRQVAGHGKQREVETMIKEKDVVNMYQYFKEMTDYERGEYDALHGFNCDGETEDYKEGFARGYEYAQQIGANSNE